MHADKRCPLVFNIILNSNRKEDTLACLASLEVSSYPNQQTLVLDNSSIDGSVTAIRERFPAVELLPLAENKGYAGNNNAGIYAALDRAADWIFLLNEDTIVGPGCLAELVGAGENCPDTGIVGPMVYHFDEPEVIQSAGGRLDRFWRSSHLGQNQPDCGQFQEVREVDWISGCAIMVRRELIEQVGPLDERFFYYWEETEWCVRARNQGWRILHVPKAKTWHKGVRRDYKPGPNVTYYSTRNRLLALSKHRAPMGVRVFAALEIVRTLASWTVKPKWRALRHHRDSMWQGALDFLRGRYGIRSR